MKMLKPSDLRGLTLPVEAAERKLADARKRADAEVAKLDARLPSEVLRNEQREIRKRIAGEVAGHVRELGGVLSAVERHRELSRPEMIRLSARFSADDLTHYTAATAWALTLNAAGAGELADLAREARAEGNVALAAAVRRHALARTDLPQAVREEIAAMADATPLPPESEAVAAELAGLQRRIEGAAIELRELESGRAAAVQDRVARAYGAAPGPLRELDGADHQDHDAGALPVDRVAASYDNAPTAD